MRFPFYDIKDMDCFFLVPIPEYIIATPFSIATITSCFWGRSSTGFRSSKVVTPNVRTGLIVVAYK